MLSDAIDSTTTVQPTGSANPGFEQKDQEKLKQPPHNQRELREHEIWWRDHQKWLESKGYMLRPRFRPGWVPSWKENETFLYPYEDAHSTPRVCLMDATRIADGKMVMFKRVSDATNPYEMYINRLLSAKPLASHPQNHCIQFIEVLEVPGDPNSHILVMPLLRRFNNPSFKTVGEAIDCFDQILEGLQFMHQCNIAHRDCMDLNIMMDPVPLYPKMYHPYATWKKINMKGTAKHYTRTRRPTRYYLIDFGLSEKFDPAKGPPRRLPVWGGDKTVPEFKKDYDAVINPFPVDIYYVGNMILECFLQKYHGVEFMVPLVRDMTQDDPSKRPTIDEVIRRMAEIKQSLPWWKLRSRLAQQDECMLPKIYLGIRHVFRTIGYMAACRSAIPSQ